MRQLVWQAQITLGEEVRLGRLLGLQQVLEVTRSPPPPMGQVLGVRELLQASAPRVGCSAVRVCSHCQAPRPSEGASAREQTQVCRLRGRGLRVLTMSSVR
jgi:hypothetical protein